MKALLISIEENVALQFADTTLVPIGNIGEHGETAEEVLANQRGMIENPDGNYVAYPKAEPQGGLTFTGHGVVDVNITGTCWHDVDPMTEAMHHALGREDDLKITLEDYEGEALTVDSSQLH